MTEPSLVWTKEVKQLVKSWVQKVRQAKEKMYDSHSNEIMDISKVVIVCQCQVTKDNKKTYTLINGDAIHSEYTWITPWAPGVSSGNPIEETKDGLRLTRWARGIILTGHHMKHMSSDGETSSGRTVVEETMWGIQVCRGYTLAELEQLSS